jgi:hypothetical protein
MVFLGTSAKLRLLNTILANYGSRRFDAAASAIGSFGNEWIG